MFVALLLSLLAISASAGSRLYKPGEQFPHGSEHLPMPQIVFLTIYMGYVKHPTEMHMRLLLESMRWNKACMSYVFINILPNISAQALDNPVIRLQSELDISNLKIVELTYSEMSKRVRDSLNLSVNFNQSWYYKLCDYKPTLAYLFPELVNDEKYQYWAFGDIDLIWGNVSRFAHLFQGQPIIQTGWFGNSGTATFYKNEPWSKSLFMSDSAYLDALQRLCYYNLDEGGNSNSECVIDNGQHSLTVIHRKYEKEKGFTIRRGVSHEDALYIEVYDSMRWAGNARWFQGNIKIVHSSDLFPAARELMYYHRPARVMNFPKRVMRPLIEDMLTYGYLLPNWVPLLSRFICKMTSVGLLSSMTALEMYKPYECIHKNDSSINSLN